MEGGLARQSNCYARGDSTTLRPGAIIDCFSIVERHMMPFDDRLVILRGFSITMLRVLDWESDL